MKSFPKQMETWHMLSHDMHCDVPSIDGSNSNISVSNDGVNDIIMNLFIGKPMRMYGI